MNTIKKFEIKANVTNIEREIIKSSSDCARIMRNFYGDDIEIYESFFLILLNRSNRVMGYAKISQGGICGTVVDKRIIAKYAIDSLCSAVILGHNHPSGNTIFSPADINVTKEIKTCLELFDIKVLDHVVLTVDEYRSMADEGVI